MIEILLAGMLAGAKPGYEPPPEIFYHQALGCVASGMVAKGKREPTSQEFADMMTWGLIMADTGRKSGRTKEQVDSGDIKLAEPFYRYLKEKKPAAFAAHRAYCAGLFVPDRK